MKLISVACPKGKKAEIEEDEEGNMLALRCVPCGPGEYTGNKGLFESCCACPEGKGTPEGQKDQCHGKSGFTFYKVPLGDGEERLCHITYLSRLMTKPIK